MFAQIIIVRAPTLREIIVFSIAYGVILTILPASAWTAVRFARKRKTHATKAFLCCLVAAMAGAAMMVTFSRDALGIATMIAFVAGEAILVISMVIAAVCIK